VRYKLEGLVFGSRLCHWNYSLTWSFLPHCGPGADSISNGNEHQGYSLWGNSSRCVRLTNLPPSCADCLDILRAPSSCSPQRLSFKRDCPAVTVIWQQHGRGLGCCTGDWCEFGVVQVIVVSLVLYRWLMWVCEILGILRVIQINHWGYDGSSL
jgi:hypothetical protein